MDEIFKQDAIDTFIIHDADSSTLTILEIPNDSVVENVHTIQLVTQKEKLENFQNCEDCTNSLLKIFDNISDDHANVVQKKCIILTCLKFSGAKVCLKIW